MRGPMVNSRLTLFALWAELPGLAFAGPLHSLNCVSSVARGTDASENLNLELDNSLLGYGHGSSSQLSSRDGA